VLSLFFGNLFYYIAILAVVVGVALYGLSYVTKFLPMLGAYALVMQVFGVILTIGGSYYVADHQGYQRRVAEDQVEIERLNGEARAKEVELNQKLAVADTALKKAKDDVKTKQSNLNALADSGELRLPSTCGVQTDSDATAVTRNSTHESESERQTVKELISIASDGDTAIIALNSCISQYNQVRDIVNKGVK